MSSSITYALVPVIFLASMTLRYIYSGYIKSPRMIKYFEAKAQFERVKEWEDYMQKCRKDYVWRYSLMLLIALIGFGFIALAQFFSQALQNVK